MNLAKMGAMAGNDPNEENQDQNQGQSDIPRNSDPLEDNASSYEDYTWLTFHGIMFLGGVSYLIMIISNWVQQVLAWLIGAIYIWSIFASRMYAPPDEGE